MVPGLRASSKMLQNPCLSHQARSTSLWGLREAFGFHRIHIQFIASLLLLGSVPCTSSRCVGQTQSTQSTQSGLPSGLLLPTVIHPCLVIVHVICVLYAFYLCILRICI